MTYAIIGVIAVVLILASFFLGRRYESKLDYQQWKRSVDQDNCRHENYIDVTTIDGHHAGQQCLDCDKRLYSRAYLNGTDNPTS